MNDRDDNKVSQKQYVPSNEELQLKPIYEKIISGMIDILKDKSPDFIDLHLETELLGLIDELSSEEIIMLAEYAYDKHFNEDYDSYIDTLSSEEFSPLLESTYMDVISSPLDYATTILILTVKYDIYKQLFPDRISNINTQFIDNDKNGKWN